MKKFRATTNVLIIMMLAVPQVVFGQVEALTETPFNPNLLVSDAEMLDVYSTTKDELASLLSRGSLGTAIVSDINGVMLPAKDIIWNASQEFSISSRFLLALLQREQSLVEDPRPSQDQMDWAMGYAICDDCSKNDPAIQKYKGFGHQVYFAAKRIRESYIHDLQERGMTQTGIGPGIETRIDKAIVIPANMATSVLYTYTPHLQGNRNFVRIWNRWFENTYVDGSLLQDMQTGGIWFIQNGQRRPITSNTAFFSRFNPQNIVMASENTLASYPIGSPIRYPNYSLLRSNRGTVYLIVDDTRRGFTSQEALRAMGFSTDEITDATWEDINAYKEAEPITVKTVYPQGILLQDKTTGGVFVVQDGVKRPIMSKEILRANFPTPSLIPVLPSELDSYNTQEPLRFPDGTLMGKKGSPDVFIVTKGERRHIVDEATFISYGFTFNQVVWTNERSVLLHPLGQDVSTRLIPDDIQLTSL